MTRIVGFLLLSFLTFINTCSAQTSPKFLTRPTDVSAALGDAAVFSCGVPRSSATLDFSLFGGHTNRTLTCPGGHVEDVPEALSGRCVEKRGQLMAIWTIRGTSLSDNSTRFVCELPDVTDRPTAVLHVFTQTSPKFLTRPTDVSAALGDAAVFSCGVPRSSATLDFSLFGGHTNRTLTCPGGHVEDVPEALSGRCVEKRGQLMAIWTIRGTSLSDNSTRFVCELPDVTDRPTAVLHVFRNGTSFYILIGCVIGAFFGVMLVFGLSYVMLQSSDSLQRCFRGRDDDTESIIEKDGVKEKVKKEEF